MLTDGQFALNTATKFDGTRGVVLKMNGEPIGILSADAARAVAATLVELADEIDPAGKATP